jgi:hypothetical protein
VQRSLADRVTLFDPPRFFASARGDRNVRVRSVPDTAASDSASVPLWPTLGSAAGPDANFKVMADPTEASEYFERHVRQEQIRGNEIRGAAAAHTIDGGAEVFLEWCDGSGFSRRLAPDAKRPGEMKEYLIEVPQLNAALEEADAAASAAGPLLRAAEGAVGATDAAGGAAGVGSGGEADDDEPPMLIPAWAASPETPAPRHTIRPLPREESPPVHVFPTRGRA